MKTLTRVCRVAMVMAVFSMLSFTESAFAQSSHTWVGLGGTDNWSPIGNWSGSIVPNGNDIINFAGTDRLNNTNNVVSSGYQIFFNSGAGAFTINGNSMNFFDFGGVDPQIQNDSANTQTINFNITGDNSANADTFQLGAVSGSMIFDGTFNMDVNNIRVFSGNGHTITFNNVVSSGGAGNRHFVLDGDTRVVFNASNTYAGETQINAGQVRIGLNGDITTSTIYLGNGGATATDAKFYLNSDANGKTFTRTINVNAGDGTSANREIGFLSATASDVGTFSGNIVRTVAGDNRGLSLYSAGGRAVFSGVISGDDVVILNGPGVIQYNNAMTYTGDTSIRLGELRVSQGASIAGGTIFVGDATLPTDTATLTISDADGGTTVARTLQVNNGSGAQYRVIGGSNTSGINTFSGGVTLQGFAQLTAASGGTVDFGGDISGATFGITKVGAGTVRLSGNNSYTGQTSIDDGTLQLGASSRISDSSAFYVASGATFDMNSFTEEVGNFVASAGNITNLVSGQQFRVNQTGDSTYSGSISGTGAFVKKGTATLALSGVNSYSGSTFIDAGELRYAASQAAGYSGTIQVGATTGSDAAVLAITNSGVAISNPITVRSNGTGARSIIARNTSGLATFAGAILVSNVLNITATSGGNLTLGGDITMHAHNITNNTTSTTTFGGQISGTGKIVKQGTGTLTLGGNNLYTGNTEIDQGTLAVTGDIANGSTTFIGNGGAGFSSANATLTLGTSGVDLGGTVQVNTSAGSGTRTIDSTATSGNTTISGNVTVNRSVTLQANSGSALTISGDLTVNNSSLITVSGANAVTLSGNISGAGAQLTKTGTGQLTLSGVNNYSGGTTLGGGTVLITPGDSITSATTINSGTMVVNGTAGAVTINGGLLKGSGTVGTLAVNAGGSFSPGNSPGTTAAGATTWAGAGTYIWEFNDFDAAQGTDPGWDFLNITGALTISATSGNPFNIDITSLTLGNLAGSVHDFDATATQTWTIATASGGVSGFVANKFNLDLSAFANPYSGTWSILQSGNDVQLRYEGAPLSLTIPEPSMVAMLSVGGMILYFRRRRALRLGRG